jgi:fructose-1,6-bisphosphatase I
MNLKPNRTLRDIVKPQDSRLYKLIAAIADLSTDVSINIAEKPGVTGTVNIFGEKQLNIDVWSNDLFVKSLLKSGLVRRIASEELDSIIKSPEGEFSVVLDPLDGSSNLVSDNLLGTIVGIYRNEELPAKGRDLVASMYFLYGPYLQLVLAMSNGVWLFFATGKGKKSARFVSSGETHKIPEIATVYGIGGARSKWTPPVREFVETLERRPLSLRYGGSFVGDYNQVLVKGGFFAYPEMVDAPKGKYRLQFESNPIAFITERAGGRACDGIIAILDVEPVNISQRVPTYLGTSSLVREFESVYSRKR